MNQEDVDRMLAYQDILHDEYENSIEMQPILEMRKVIALESIAQHLKALNEMLNEAFTAYFYTQK
jgi:hypothetical protein